VTFDRNAQAAAAAIGQPRDIAFGFFDARDYGIGQRQQTLASRREGEWHRFTGEQGQTEMVFQRFQLVRQRRLGHTQPLGRARHIAGITQRKQGLQMA